MTDWNTLTRSYSVWDDKNIKGFFGEYRWLSNFQSCSVWFRGLEYPSSENAYQAAKVDVDSRQSFLTCSATKSKTLWKEFPSLYTTEQWDEIRYDIMSEILFNKFKSGGLRQKLIETADKHLVEINHWHDVYWGVDYKSGNGENKLGEILMKIRKYLS